MLIWVSSCLCEYNVIVQSISLLNFRNINRLTVDFSEGFNVFSGGNGQGKTNILEALFFSCSLRSFRTSKIKDLISFDCESAQLDVFVHSRDIQRSFKTQITGTKKVCQVDGKNVRNLKKYALDSIMVFFGPDDLWLMKGSPQQRRDFLDRSILNVYPDFEKLKKEYNKVLKQRNALLREQEINSDFELILDVLDQQLVLFGQKIIDLRVKYIEKNRVKFQSNTRSILGKQFEVQCFYEAKQLDSSFDDQDLNLESKISESRKNDIVRRQTLLGPHRDDLIFYMNGQNAHHYSSQGQLRSMVLAWKMTEIEFIEKTVECSPVLLLDDVSSELDTQKNSNLFDVLNEKGLQCFISTTDKNHVKLIENRCDFKVDEGAFTPL